MFVWRTAECLQTPFEREGKPLPYRSVGGECRVPAPPNVCGYRSNGRFVNRPYGTGGKIVLSHRRMSANAVQTGLWGKCRIRAINRGERVYVRVDAFNENGITHGQAVRLR